MMTTVPSNEQLSKDVSDFLDELGFTETQIRQRIHHSSIQTIVKNLSIKLCIDTSNERLFVGSISEGIGFYHLSDLDVLQIDHNVICTQGDQHVAASTNNNKLVIELVEPEFSPGYCYLELAQNDPLLVEPFKYAVVERNDRMYISSELFKTQIDDDNVKVSNYMKTHTRYQSPTGPSIPKYVKHSYVNFIFKSLTGIPQNNNIDFVRAFPCDGLLALKSWEQRPRQSDWPSQQMIRHIMTLPVYVVPVGQQGNVDENIQWRISYVQAELYLVQSFNNVQSKILVLLKLIVKHYLDCPGISSYIVKNIMFWMAERNPQKKFRKKHLLARLNEALEMLKDAVNKETLPSYIQLEKNLLANKLTKSEQENALIQINILLDHGMFLVRWFLYPDDMFYPVDTKFIDIAQCLELCSCVTDVQMARLAMFPLLDQVKFYLSIYKLNYDEEQWFNNMLTLPRFVMTCLIHDWKYVNSIDLPKKHLAIKCEATSATIEADMLRNKEAIHTKVDRYCKFVWFIGMFLRVFVMMCKTSMFVLKLAIKLFLFLFAVTLSIVCIFGLFVTYFAFTADKSRNCTMTSYMQCHSLDNQIWLIPGDDIDAWSNFKGTCVLEYICEPTHYI